MKKSKGLIFLKRRGRDHRDLVFLMALLGVFILFFWAGTKLHNPIEPLIRQNEQLLYENTKLLSANSRLLEELREDVWGE